MKSTAGRSPLHELRAFFVILEVLFEQLRPAVTPRISLSRERCVR